MATERWFSGMVVGNVRRCLLLDVGWRWGCIGHPVTFAHRHPTSVAPRTDSDVTGDTRGRPGRLSNPASAIVSLGLRYSRRWGRSRGETVISTDDADAAGEVTNWFGDIAWSPARQVTPTSIDDVVEIVRDPSYPSPIRAVGSNHSTTPCAAADGGTTVFMSAMAKIVSIDEGEKTVTAQAGAHYHEVADALRERGLQFYVNIELGDLTMGAASTVGTKEAAFPGEHGQVASYLASATVVTADGEVRVIDESDPQLMRAFRSSHGTFGIICEVTFRVRPIQPMSVHHEVFTLDEYLDALPELISRDASLMMYMDPFRDRIAVEVRNYGDAFGDRTSRWQWKLRNTLWRDAGPWYASVVRRFVPWRRVREALFGFSSVLMFTVLRYVLRGKRTVASDQQIDYPPVGSDSRYTFSIWTFPVDRYPDALRAYFELCKQYERDHGFRVTLPSVGYRTFRDQQALLSYSYDSDVMTVDPVTTPAPGWDDFLHAYNDFASSHGGSPLLNQSKHITREHVRTAFGERIDQFERYRQRLDPEGRFRSPFFAELLG